MAHCNFPPRLFLYFCQVNFLVFYFYFCFPTVIILHLSSVNISQLSKYIKLGWKLEPQTTTFIFKYFHSKNILKNIFLMFCKIQNFPLCINFIFISLSLHKEQHLYYLSSWGNTLQLFHLNPSLSTQRPTTTAIGLPPTWLKTPTLKNV